MQGTFVNEPIQIPVLNNDFDPDGDDFFICDFTQPLNGSVILVDGEFFTYTPNPDFIGVDTFTYTICDENGNESTATVTITIQPALATMIVNDDQYTVDANRETALYVLENDGFPNVCQIELEIVDGPDRGDVYVNVDGSIAFIPETDWTGNTSFVYRLTVCGFTDEAKVELTVRHAEYNVTIPTGFSPNGDGINDELHPKGLEFFEGQDVTARFIAFNRWGQILYTNDYALETPSLWDGSTKPGQMAVSGTYFYVLEIFTEVDQYHSVGFVELRR